MPGGNKKKGKPGDTNVENLSFYRRADVDDEFNSIVTEQTLSEQSPRSQKKRVVADDEPYQFAIHSQHVVAAVLATLPSDPAQLQTVLNRFHETVENSTQSLAFFQAENGTLQKPKMMIDVDKGDGDTVISFQSADPSIPEPTMEELEDFYNNDIELHARADGSDTIVASIDKKGDLVFNAFDSKTGEVITLNDAEMEILSDNVTKAMQAYLNSKQPDTNAAIYTHPRGTTANLDQLLTSSQTKAVPTAPVKSAAPTATPTTTPVKNAAPTATPTTAPIKNAAPKTVPTAPPIVVDVPDDASTATSATTFASYAGPLAPAKKQQPAPAKQAKQVTVDDAVALWNKRVAPPLESGNRLVAKKDENNQLMFDLTGLNENEAAQVESLQEKFASMPADEVVDFIGGLDKKVSLEIINHKLSKHLSKAPMSANANLNELRQGLQDKTEKTTPSATGPHRSNVTR